MKKMYGVDKYGHIYLFDVISEFSNEIIVKMTNQLTNQSINLQSVEFYIKQQENSLFYTITHCSDLKCYLTMRDYEIIISKCKEDIAAKRYSIINEYYDNKIKEQEDLIKSSTDMLNSLNRSYKSLNFNNLELNDKVILLRKNNQYEGTVTSFVTKDKIKFTPRISCEEISIEDVEIVFNPDEDSDDPETNELNLPYEYYTYPPFSDILVFLDDTDLRNYRNYLSFKEYVEFKKDCECEIRKLRNKKDNEIKNIENF